MLINLLIELKAYFTKVKSDSSKQNKMVDEREDKDMYYINNMFIPYIYSINILKDIYNINIVCSYIMYI